MAPVWTTLLAWECSLLLSICSSQKLRYSLPGSRLLTPFEPSVHRQICPQSSHLRSLQLLGRTLSGSSPRSTRRAPRDSPTQLYHLLTSLARLQSPQRRNNTGNCWHHPCRRAGVCCIGFESKHWIEKFLAFGTSESHRNRAPPCSLEHAGQPSRSRLGAETQIQSHSRRNSRPRNPSFQRRWEIWYFTKRWLKTYGRTGIVVFRWIMPALGRVSALSPEQLDFVRSEVLWAS